MFDKSKLLESLHITQFEQDIGTSNVRVVWTNSDGKKEDIWGDNLESLKDCAIGEIEDFQVAGLIIYRLNFHRKFIEEYILSLEQ